jgi:hypothetical protein
MLAPEYFSVVGRKKGKQTHERLVLAAAMSMHVLRVVTPCGLYVDAGDSVCVFPNRYLPSPQHRR